MIAFEKATEDTPKGDPMVVLRCDSATQKGLRCRNHSGWMPESLLVDENGEWFCHVHRARRNPRWLA